MGIFFLRSEQFWWEFAVPARVLDICLTFTPRAPPPDSTRHLWQRKLRSAHYGTVWDL